jgi:hypothetical protein
MYSLPIHSQPIHSLSTFYSLPIYYLSTIFAPVAFLLTPSHCPTASPNCLGCSVWCDKCTMEGHANDEPPTSYQKSPISFHSSYVFLGLHVTYLISYISIFSQHIRTISASSVSTRTKPAIHKNFGTKYSRSATSALWNSVTTPKGIGVQKLAHTAPAAHPHSLAYSSHAGSDQSVDSIGQTSVYLPATTDDTTVPTGGKPPP